MKLSENGIEIRDRLHDKIHAKYGIKFISELLTDRKMVNLINQTADEILKYDKHIDNKDVV